MAHEAAVSSYLPALYDPSTSTLHMHPSAPLYLLTHRVKRLREPNATFTAKKDKDDVYRAKRNTLGEAFGSKKAKTQIKAEERNKLNAGAMHDIKGHIISSIGEKPQIEGGFVYKTRCRGFTETLLGPGAVSPSDLIPSPNSTTYEVSEIYTRDILIPSEEFHSIDVSGILAAQDDRGRTSALPWRSSRWIEDKMREIVESGSNRGTKKSSL